MVIIIIIIFFFCRIWSIIQSKLIYIVDDDNDGSMDEDCAKLLPGKQEKFLPVRRDEAFLFSESDCSIGPRTVVVTGCNPNDLDIWTDWCRLTRHRK